MRINLDAPEGEETAVPLAPLIDCVFLLLIFFIVTAAVRKIHKEVDIDLPDFGAKVPAKDPDDVVIIAVDRKGTILIHAEPVTKQTLHKHLKGAAAKNPNTRVRIDADRATAFQYVAYVMDLCQFEGLKDIGLRARDR